jgi:hypothetical protein
MVNLTRARDAATSLALRILQVEETRLGGARTAIPALARPRSNARSRSAAALLGFAPAQCRRAYPITTSFGGKTVPCIRVRAFDGDGVAEDEDPAPKKKSKPLSSKDETDIDVDLDDEIPF